MRKHTSKCGFTLAELLVVVAIICVLVAIAIPVFGGYLDKSTQAVDSANFRNARSIASINYLDHGCVASDCPGNCGSSHNAGCWFDADSGQIISAVEPTAGYNQHEQYIDYSEFGGGIHTFEPKTAVIWTGNSSVVPTTDISGFTTYTISLYWHSI